MIGGFKGPGRIVGIEVQSRAAGTEVPKRRKRVLGAMADCKENKLVVN